MVAFKAAQVPRFLANPDSKQRAFLLYGPEAGLVSDRAANLARVLSERSDPHAEIIKLDERDLADDPDRLALETQTVSMFADHKVVRVKTGPRLRVELLGDLITAGHEALLIVEAGNLRPAAKLRKIFETADSAAALPCYGNAARDMPQLIDRELDRLGISIAADAKSALLALIGSDPALARAEIEKLALYCRESGTIGSDDVEAVIADSGDIALDALAQATAEKKRDHVLRNLDRLAASGQSPQSGLMALARHFDRLHRVLGEVEAGKDPARAIAGLRPPPSFSQRDALTRQARLWTLARVERAVLALHDAIAQSRRRPQLERQITERLALQLCQ